MSVFACENAILQEIDVPNENGILILFSFAHSALAEWK